MKVLILSLFVISAVYCYPQHARTQINSAPTGVATAARTTGTVGNPYGPKAYGPGLNNPYAFPPNQFAVQRALQVANAQQGVLVRVDVNGEVELTDQFGQEVDVFDRFGNDLSELYDI